MGQKSQPAHLPPGDAEVGRDRMRCCASFVTRETQIKATTRHRCSPARTAGTWNPGPQAWRGCGAAGTLGHCPGDEARCSHFGGRLGGFLQNMTQHWKPGGGAPPPKGDGNRCPQKHPHTGCSQQLYLSLQIFAKTWKQPRYSG